MEVPFAGPRFSVEIQTWPRDRRRDVVRAPGACAAVVFDDRDRILLVRQMREAASRLMLEVPAGLYDVEGEKPEDSIRREILEETGLRVVTLEHMGKYFSSPGFTDETIDLFIAWGETEAEPEEGIEVVPLAFDEALRWVADGRIDDAHTALALLLADLHLKAKGPPGIL